MTTPEGAEFEITQGAYATDLALRWVDQAGDDVDISTVANPAIILLDPDGTRTSTVAAYDADVRKNKIKITLANGQLDVAGIWRCQGYGEIAGVYFGHTSIFDFVVVSNL